jgi:tetratricopeptide (TPR) repeat protein
MWTAAGARITMQDEFRPSSPENIRAHYHKHAMGNSLFHNNSSTAKKKEEQKEEKEKEKQDGREDVGTGDPARPAGQRPAPPFTDTTDLSAARIGRWAWSSDSFDFDHDGFPDLYIANGMVSTQDRNDLNSFFWRQVVANSPDEPKPSHDYEQGWGAINELIRADRTWSGYERNTFYANNGDGTFSDISGALNLDFLEDGRSFALADFDLDGRQEVFLKNRNAPQLRILHNNLPDLPPSISFRLQGTKSNPDAIGAVVTIAAGALAVPVETRLAASPHTPTRSIQAGSGFISQHSKDVFFGLGKINGPVTARIHWPGGQVQEFHDLPPNHRIWIEEGATQPTRIEPFREPRQLGWFDASLPSNSPRDFWLSEHTIESWLLAPIAAPDFSLSNRRTGTQQSLATQRGKPVLLQFGTAGDERTEKDWSTFAQHFTNWMAQGLQLTSINFGPNQPPTNAAFPILQGTDDVAAIYSILFRYLFDRHRDLDLPTSFLINSDGEIVKVYQGPIDPSHIEHDFRNIPATSADRMASALPYPGVAEITEFGRNYLSFGSVYFQRGYLDQAAAAFQIALRDDPESAEALYGIGSVFLDQQKNKEARDCFERTLKLRASYPDTLANAWNNLGLLAGREGRVIKAIANFQQALKLSPDHLIALNNLGSAYRQSKRWDEAQQTYQRALTLKPQDAEANYGMGMIYAQGEDTAHAEESLKKALQLRPIYPEALNNLGILYLRTNRRDQAVANFKQSITVAPDFDQSYLNLARVYALEGNPEKARKVLKDLLTRRPNNPVAQQMLSQLSK